jgi:hypothetical protein
LGKGAFAAIAQSVKGARMEGTSDICGLCSLGDWA